jgi:hypothetical protein
VVSATPLPRLRPGGAPALAALADLLVGAGATA